jgi:hypothetical protein
MASVRRELNYGKKPRDAIPPNQVEPKRDAATSPTASSSSSAQTSANEMLQPSPSRSSPKDSVWWNEVVGGVQSIKWNWQTARLTVPLWMLAPIVAFLVFSNGLHGGLVFDDSEVVGRNPDVRGTRDYMSLWWNDYWGNLINAEGVWTCKVPTRSPQPS